MRCRASRPTRLSLRKRCNLIPGNSWKRAAPRPSPGSSRPRSPPQPPPPLLPPALPQVRLPLQTPHPAAGPPSPWLEPSQIGIPQVSLPCTSCAGRSLHGDPYPVELVMGNR